MNCTHARQMLDAYLDGEADATTRLDVAEHLTVCPACAEIRTDREALVQLVRATAPRYPAPPLFARRLRENIPAVDAARRSRFSMLRAAATILVVAAGSAALGFFAGRSAPATPPHEALVARHVASLTSGGHLFDVQSSDHHTVKPWLQGKVDFAPLVLDLSKQGYVMLGARLDNVNDRAAVALVYRIRNHVINLFVWRADDHSPLAPVFARARGYGVATWTQGGLTYSAISDVDRGDLETFAALMQEPSR
jgi:anti-sigma factor RsiW